MTALQNAKPRRGGALVAFTGEKLSRRRLRRSRARWRGAIALPGRGWRRLAGGLVFALRDAEEQRTEQDDGAEDAGRPHP